MSGKNRSFLHPVKTPPQYGLVGQKPVCGEGMSLLEHQKKQQLQALPISSFSVLFKLFNWKYSFSPQRDKGKLSGPLKRISWASIILFIQLLFNCNNYSVVTTESIFVFRGSVQVEVNQGIIDLGSDSIQLPAQNNLLCKIPTITLRNFKWPPFTSVWSALAYTDVQCRSSHIHRS